MNTKDTILKECKNRITQRHVHLDWDALSEHGRNKYHDLVCKEYAEILTEKYRSLILEQSELINKLNNLLVKIYRHRFDTDEVIEKLFKRIAEHKRELDL